VNVVQALLLNAKGETRFWISPECPRLIEALERQPYNEQGEPDKKTGYDHPNDAVGYPLHRLFAAELGYGPGGPMRITTATYGHGSTALLQQPEPPPPRRRSAIPGFR
jgi:hypothetical protein